MKRKKDQKIKQNLPSRKSIDLIETKSN